MRVPSWLRAFWASRRWYWRLGRMVALFIILGGCAPTLFENQLIYHPSRYPIGEWELADARPAPGRTGPVVEDVWFTAADGKRLNGWLCTPARNVDGTIEPLPTGDRTIIWCHGNAGNITHRFDRVRRFVDFPASIFVFDYRGFGRSEGRPNEKGVYRDADAAWDYLVTTRGIPPGRIVIYGVSLGAAVATHLAVAQPDAAGLVIESAFTSIPDMAAHSMPWVPRLFVRTRMDNRARIPAIHLPKLFIHGDADEVVPYAMGRELWEIAADGRPFYTVVGGTHNDTLWVGGEPYVRAIAEFVDEVAPNSQENVKKTLAPPVE